MAAIPMNPYDFPGTAEISSWTEADLVADRLRLSGHIKDFSPLTDFANLRHLWVWAANQQQQLAVIGKLTPLTRLKSLQVLDILNSFPLEDMAMLAAALPKTEGIFHLSHEVLHVNDEFLRCKKCGGQVRIRLIGTVKSRPGLLCPVCDAKKVSRHVVEYEQLRERFARELG